MVLPVNCLDKLVQNDLCKYLKKEKMRANNTFGVHFVLRTNRGKNGKAAIYVRIVVNKSRSEIALKRLVDISDWNLLLCAAWQLISVFGVALFCAIIF